MGDFDYSLPLRPDLRTDRVGRRVLTELARRNFYIYCQLMAPTLYDENHLHLKTVCQELQAFYESDDRFFILNMPPRHGKTVTTTFYTTWVLGRDPHLAIMAASYGLRLSTQASVNVRNIIETDSIETERIKKGTFIFKDIFPEVRLTQGEKSKSNWKLEGSGRASYIPTSPDASATGFGANFLIVDDPVKNDYEARDKTRLEAIWTWFKDTMLSRRENDDITGMKSKVLIIMTRWSTDDLTAKILDNNFKTKHLIMKAYNPETDQMLCEAMFSREDYEKQLKLTADKADVFEANYNQEPFDLEGALYSNIKTYNPYAPKVGEYITTWCYIDTADRGSDYLCAIAFDEYYVASSNESYAYVKGIVYTQDDMTITENIIPQFLLDNEVATVRIESNNGGINFARSIEKKLSGSYINVEHFHQKYNKEARIYTGAAGVQKYVLMPDLWAWDSSWNSFYKAISTFDAKAKNKHDDGPDALTGVFETLQDYGYANIIGYQDLGMLKELRDIF